MKITTFSALCLSVLLTFISYGQDTDKASEVAINAVCGRWQATNGDSYTFDSDGIYEHWLQIPPVSKAAQAEDIDGSKRIGISGGRFSVDGNFLVLTQKDGTTNTNIFLVKKDEPGHDKGKFFDSGYSLTLTKNEGNGKRYELVYW
jgi:hypothetical protein